MDNEKRISIVVPVYNIELYIEKCIESIRNQSYTNLEIILVDDGSTDCSGQICDKHAQLDQRIEVIHKGNGGLVSARKAGIKYATGEYCINVDGDDWIDSNMVEKLYNSIVSSKADFVQCGYVEEGCGSNMYCYEELIVNLNENENRNRVLTSWMSGSPIIGSQIFTKIFKTSFLKQCYDNVPEEMNLGEDMICFIYYLKNASLVASISEVLYHYQVRKGSLSHDDATHYILREDLLTEKVYTIVLKSFSEKLINQLEEWVLNRKLSLLNYKLGLYIPRYTINNLERFKNKKIVIYGAGKVGTDCVNQLLQTEDINIVLWVDKDYHKYSSSVKRVYSPADLDNIHFDYIIIAVLNKDIAKEIKDKLQIELNVPEEAIVWDIKKI